MTRIACTLLFLVATAVAVPQDAMCPQDGGRAHFTGSTKGVGRQKACQYAHYYRGSLHEFWQACD
jgi:hypothetical protein